MSIIYNALKKSEENGPDNSKNTTDPTNSNINPMDTKAPHKENTKQGGSNTQIIIKIIAIVGLLACMGFFVFTIVSQGNSNTNSRKMNLSFGFLDSFKGSAKNTDSGYRFSPSKYKLNGVLASDSKTIAMINGDSYAEGSTIDDLTINEITNSKIVFLAPTNEEFTIEID